MSNEIDGLRMYIKDGYLTVELYRYGDMGLEVIADDSISIRSLMDAVEQEKFRDD